MAATLRPEARRKISRAAPGYPPGWFWHEGDGDQCRGRLDGTAGQEGDAGAERTRMRPRLSRWLIRRLEPYHRASAGWRTASTIELKTNLRRSATVMVLPGPPSTPGAITAGLMRKCRRRSSPGAVPYGSCGGWRRNLRRRSMSDTQDAKLLLEFYFRFRRPTADPCRREIDAC